MRPLQYVEDGELFLSIFLNKYIYFKVLFSCQVSGDEQRRLCGEQAKYNERCGLGLGVGLTTYGSVAYQLKDANMEASGTMDFVCRAAKIMNRTSKFS